MHQTGLQTQSLGHSDSSLESLRTPGLICCFHMHTVQQRLIPTHLLTGAVLITLYFDDIKRSPCSDNTFIQITHSPIWSARLSSLLCQLGVDFPLPPISDWVFCLSMEAGDLRLTPNLWWFPQTKARHIRISNHKVNRVLVLMTGITSFCLHVCARRYISLLRKARLLLKSSVNQGTELASKRHRK